jgi:hypothetical protein
MSTRYEEIAAPPSSAGAAQLSWTLPSDCSSAEKLCGELAIAAGVEIRIIELGIESPIAFVAISLKSWKVPRAGIGTMKVVNELV